MALPKKLYQTTITIWTESPTDSWTLSDLAREAETGEAYCDSVKCVELTEKEKFPDTEFFGVEEQEEPPQVCQNPQCKSLGMSWSHTHPVGHPESPVWAWVCDSCGCVQEKKLFAVIHTATGEISEESGAPYEGYSADEVEEELMKRHLNGELPFTAKEALRRDGLEVVPLTDELEAQYRALDPDNA